jgi:hypothetical protein
MSHGHLIHNRFRGFLDHGPQSVPIDNPVLVGSQGFETDQPRQFSVIAMDTRRDTSADTASGSSNPANAVPAPEPP